MKSNEIKIENFKLNIFRTLLEQSSIVSNQLMFEVSSEMIKSCSFSSTKSFMKLWTIPLKQLIVRPEKPDNQLEMLEETLPELNFDFETFNVYILKGDLFKKFLSVHATDTVDLIITIKEGTNQASNLTVISKIEGTNNQLKTNFELSTEEIITDKIDDYSEVLKSCTPSEDMYQFILSDAQIQEIKRLIKNLHKSRAENTAYLTFYINSETHKITVKDKVFEIEFSIDPELQDKIKFPSESFEFKVLKSDFIITGNQTFSIYTNAETEKIIFGATYAGAIIWCLSAKITDSTELNFDASVAESSLDELNIDEYIGDNDLPF